jgi:hypothetical protein
MGFACRRPGILADKAILAGEITLLIYSVEERLSNPTGLQVLKCRVSGQRRSWHPSSYQERGCRNGRATEDPANPS